MEQPSGEQVQHDAEVADETSERPPVKTDVHCVWQAVRYILHLGVIYLITTFATPYLAGWAHGKLLPLLGHRASSSAPEFMFSHLFVFSFIPAFLTGFANARFRHTIAQFVWVVPVVFLVYKIAIFPTAASVLYASSGFVAGLHCYFGGGFAVPEFRSFRDMFENADAVRGLAQIRFTAPFYAAIGYSLATFICVRWKRSLPEVVESVEHWHKETRLPQR